MCMLALLLMNTLSKIDCYFRIFSAFFAFKISLFLSDFFIFSSIACANTCMVTAKFHSVLHHSVVYTVLWGQKVPCMKIEYSLSRHKDA